MAIPTSGEISILDIFNEFGGPSSGGYGLSDYYRNGSYVTGNNTNVPTSGEIALSDFYGAFKGVEIEYSVTGGGGAGGYGVDNGSVSPATYGPAGIGSGIFAKIGTSNTNRWTASGSGGSGGRNGSSAQGTGSGGNGEDSALSTQSGGSGGSRNNSGGAGSRGGGGGGGGGDAPSRYDRSGAAGEGGGAGGTTTGTQYSKVGDTITLSVGRGGPTNTPEYDGGAGGGGEISIGQPNAINLTTNSGSPYYRRVFGNTTNSTQTYSYTVIPDGPGYYLNTEFANINTGSWQNRTNEADTNNPYHVGEVRNFYNGNGRLVIAHKSDYSGSTYFNDVPIAAVQVLNYEGNVAQTWWFGSNAQSWQTTTGAARAGNATPGINQAPDASLGSFTNIGTGYNNDRFMLASSTGSARTGATGGIENPGTTPMPVGFETMPQSGSRNYIFRETSGTNPRYSQKFARSPSRTWSAGETVRVAFIIGNNSSGTYDWDDILYVGIDPSP